MKTFAKYLIGKVLKYLANLSAEELLIAVKLVIDASKRFSVKENSEKFNFVLTELKQIYKGHEESALRYLIETAVRWAKVNSQI